jgi:sodium-dependent dicarboxylate transporter 2/3/5
LWPLHGNDFFSRYHVNLDKQIRSGRLARIGLIAGPLVALLVYLSLPLTYTDVGGLQQTLAFSARITAAIAALMAVWWMTEAISVYATALIPLALFPLAGISGVHDTAAAYGNEIVYLFLGGFILALALEKWGLHRRLALTVLAAVGAEPRTIIGAFMAVSAILSMWVTNTATTIMLLPVAISVIRMLPEKSSANIGNENPFALCLLLGIAYASSIGGMGTIIGTAPNIFVVSFITENLQREIGFLEWMRFAVPLVIIFVPVAWLVLTRFVFAITSDELPEAAEMLQRERAELAPLGRGELLTFMVFVLTAVAWVTRPLLNRIEIGDINPLGGLSDPGIAIIAALLLFIIPTNLRRGEFLMDWATALRLPWGLLILFGGGLALAAAFTSTGFSLYLGNLFTGLAAWPVWVVVLLVTALVVFLTELTSNTATTATLVPILLAVSTALELQPLLLILPAAFAASCAFMLPVATPPNAIVFGSGLVGIRQMSRAGFWLNVIAIGLITLATYIIIIPAFGISL